MAIQLSVVTPRGEVFDGPVDQVVLPGSEGEFGVLQAHERTLAPLKPGRVQIQTAGAVEWAVVSDGFADVSAEQVVVLVDACHLASEIDRAATERDRERIQAELHALGGSEQDAARRAGLEQELAFADLLLSV